MAIAYHNLSSAVQYSGVTGSSVNVGHTISTADQTNVYALVSLGTSSIDVTGVTFGGSPMTEVGSKVTIGSRQYQIFWIGNVSAGAQSANFTFSANSYYTIKVYSFTGCANQAPEVVVNDSGTGTQTTNTITPVTGDSMILSMVIKTTLTNGITAVDGQDRSLMEASGGATTRIGATGYQGPITGTPSTNDRYSWSGSDSWAQTSIAIKPGSPPATLDLEGYRFRNDNGSETTATWLANQDTGITRAIETTTRLRTLINAANNPDTLPFKLEYKLNSASDWKAVGEGQAGIVDAYPVVEEVVQGGTGTTNVTSHAITMPSTINAGDLLLLIFSVDQNPTLTAPTGWTRLGRESNGNVVTGAIYFKIATGGDTATVTSGVAEQSTHIVYRISNGAPPIGAAANANTTNSNPPNLDMGASGKYLLIATRHGDAQVVATAAPSGYSDLKTETASGAGGASTNSAHRTATLSSEDPGTFTSAAENWAAWTLAIPPKNTHEVAVGADATGTNDTSIGTLAWTAPGNISDSDDTRATRTLSGLAITNYLRGSSFGINLPSDATILGIQVAIEKVRTGGTAGAARDNSIRLFKTSGAVGDNKADTATNWAATEDTHIYGGARDLWGTTWSVADVNSTDFGVGIAVTGSTSSTDRIVNVDQMRILVYYSLPTAPPVFDLSASTNIAVGGEATTAQLTPPSGKTTSNFTAGRIQDDENPADTVDIGIDGYTELEWAIEATSEATNGEVYQFRITYNGQPLDTYTVTPEWTIGAGFNQFYETIAATCTGSAAATTQTNRNRSISATVTGSAGAALAKALSRTIAAIATGAAAISKAAIYTKAVAATVTGNINITKGKLIFKDVIATVTGLANVATLANRYRTIAATVTGSAIVVAEAILNRAVAAIATGSATVSTQANRIRTIAATVTGAATIVVARTYGRTVEAIATGAVTITHLTVRGRTIAATVTGAATVAAYSVLSRAIAAVVTGSSAITHSKVLERTVAAIATATATVARLFMPQRLIAAVVTAQTDVQTTKHLLKTIAATIVGIATVQAASTAGRLIAATVTAVTNVTHLSAFNITVSAIATGQATVSKLFSISQNVVAIVTANVSIARAVHWYRQITATVTANVAVSYMRLFIRSIAAIATGLASVSISRRYSRTVAAVAISVTNVIRSVQFYLSVAAIATAVASTSLSLNLYRTIAATVTGVASLSTQALRFVTVAATVTANIFIQIGAKIFPYKNKQYYQTRAGYAKVNLYTKRNPHPRKGGYNPLRRG